MPEKFQNKYRIPSTRWQDWNYRDAAAYFITICTRNREHYFGEIRDGKMYLSTIGTIVESEWLKTPEIRADMNLELDEFVVMPNHFHAILIIGENEFNGTPCVASPICIVETPRMASLPNSVRNPKIWDL